MQPCLRIGHVRRSKREAERRNSQIAGQQLQTMVALANWKDAPGPYLIQSEEMSVLTYGVGQQPFRLQIDTNIGVIDLREHLDLRTEPFSLIAGDHSPQLCGIAPVDTGEQPSAPHEVENQDPEQPTNRRVFATGQTQKKWQVEARKSHHN